MIKLRDILREAEFITKPYSVIINPIYILRNGIYRALCSLSTQITGDVLDFGCGSKPYEKIFKEVNSYVGVDIAVSGHEHSDSKIDFFYDGITLPFSDNSFDSVVCFDVLEHVFNIDRVMAEITRVLKPGGKFLVSVPFAWDEHEVPYDFARYTSYGLESIFQKYNFSIKKSIKTTTYFLAICQIFIAYLEQYVLPKGRYFGRLGQIFIICPLTITSLILNQIFPKRNEYFSGIVQLGVSTKSIK